MDKTILESAHKVKKLYKNLTYFDQYGTSIILCIILLTILFWVHGYYTIMANVQPIKDNWVKRRCDPKVIPFAGLINKPDNQTATEFTQDNFTQCVQDMLKPVTQKAVSPFDYMTRSFLAVFGVIIAAFQRVREMSSVLRDQFAVIAENIMGRLINFIVPIQQIVMAIKDSMAKVVGVMQTSINTGVGLLFAIKSLLGVIVTSAIQVLLILLAVLIALIIIMVIVFFFLPGYFFYVAGLVGTYSTFYMTIVGLLMFIIAFLQINLGIQQVGVIPGLPDVPRLCFDGNTQVLLLNQTYKNICEIQVGDVLSDGGIVTAKMQLNAHCVDMYDLNGVIVSAKHRVKYNDKWVHVSDHPSAKLLFEYNQPHIYCMNTTTKQFIINNMTFIDWDEIFEHENIVLSNIFHSEYDILPGESLDYIHKYYDGGFEADVEILLNNGEILPINKICVGSILSGDVHVHGIVVIDKTMIENKTNIYKNKEGVHNLEESSTKLYHLLTDKGYFYVDETKFPDYNNYIDSLI